MTEEQKRYTRSVSQLKTYTRCGQAYYLERMVKPKLPKTPAAWTAVGTAFHTAYEAWELSDRSEDLADLFDVEYPLEIGRLKEAQPDLALWQKRPAVKSVERDIDLYEELGHKQAEAYQAHCELAEWELFELPNGMPALEVGFEIELGGIVVRGKIDTILKWHDGRITVRDLKTGNKEEDNRQLGLYRHVAIEQFGLDLQWGEYFYTKRGVNGGWVDLTRYSREYLSEQYASLDRGIDARVFLARPGQHCDMCGVKPYCPERGWRDVPGG